MGEFKFDIRDEDNYAKTCGIAKQAGISGNQFEVYIGGVAYEPDSGWLPGETYYVSATGQLTRTPPDRGIVKVIGVD